MKKVRLILQWALPAVIGLLIAFIGDRVNMAGFANNGILQILGTILMLGGAAVTLLSIHHLIDEWKKLGSQRMYKGKTTL